MADLDPRIPPGDSPEHSPPPEETVHTNGKKQRKRTVFYISATVIAILLFAAAFHEPILGVFKYVLAILSPLTIGMVIAYLCNPILEFFEYRIFRRMEKGSLRRGLSLFLTIIVAFGIVAIVFAMMIPQLYQSVTELVNNYNTYLDGLSKWLQSGIDRLPEHLPISDIDVSDSDKLKAFINKTFGIDEESLAPWMDKFQDFASKSNLADKTWSALTSLFNSFKNLFIGLFIAFYFLASKEKRVAQFRKFRKAMLNEKHDSKLGEFIDLVDQTFGGFIFGKMLDSLVIGILTFILLTIFEVSPYNMLIATFIGLTNVIPVFGPFIGAIPSFFVVLISNPSKAILFLILILIIQQLDGNVIGPKILGDNTGVSSLCVIIAIAVCSAMWGFVGMIIGVPIFAVIIELIKRMLEKRLRKKGEPTETEAYFPANAVGIAEQDMHYEHSHLRYSYEHSRIKPRVDRIRNSLINHLGRKPNPAQPDDPASAESSADDNGDSANT